MIMNDHLKLIQSLEETSSKLDHHSVSWINKYLVIDLKQKSDVLLESITKLEDTEKEHAIIAANDFLIEVKPVIELLDKGEQ